MKLPEIVGIAGTNGAGKDELGKLLAERCGYHFVSVTDLLREELGRRGLPVEREHMANLSREWRNESGDHGIMFTKAIEKFMTEEAAKGYKGLVAASIRHPGEVHSVQKHGGVVVWVDADERVRYDRITSANRGRIDDQKTFEEFQAEQHREMHPPADAPAGTLDMSSVRDLADITVINEYPSLEEYRAALIEQFEL